MFITRLDWVALPAVQAKLLSSCASAYTTAAETLARWCAKNELGDERVVPYWVEPSEGLGRGEARLRDEPV